MTSPGKDDDHDGDVEEVLRRTASGMPTPEPPAWLTTRLTAEFRRRHGHAPPRREHRLVLVHDSRTADLVGARGAQEPDDFTLHLAGDGDAPEVVLDVRADGDTAAVDGLVLHGGGAAYHVRATLDAGRVDADMTSRDGRFSFRELPMTSMTLLLDDGPHAISADIDLTRSARP